MPGSRRQVIFFVVGCWVAIAKEMAELSLFFTSNTSLVDQDTVNSQRSAIVEVTASLLSVNESDVGIYSWNNATFAVPSANPTVAPTQSPTGSPTLAPTLTLTLAPTLDPTASPTLSPTKVPTTIAPSPSPTTLPTLVPTRSPSLVPTLAPSLVPTLAPTLSPTQVPTAMPTLTELSLPFRDDFCSDKGFWEAMSGSSWSIGGCEYSAGSMNSPAGTTWVGYYDNIDLSEWTDYNVEWEMEISSSCTGSAGVLIRAQTEASSTTNDWGQQYYFGQQWTSSGTSTMIAKINDGWSTLAQTSSGISGRSNGNITARGSVIGSTLSFTVTLTNGESQTVEVTDSTYTWGTIGLRASGCPTVFKYINVTSGTTEAPTNVPTLAPTITPTIAPTAGTYGAGFSASTLEALAPLLYWRMDSFNATTGAALDASGNGRAGALTGSSTVAGAPRASGRLGTAVYVEGGYYATGPSGLDAADAWTVALWAEVTGGDGGWRSPVSHLYYSGSVYKGLVVHCTSSNTWRVTIGVGGSVWQAADGGVSCASTAGTGLRFLAAVLDPAEGTYGTLRLYIDAELVASTTLSYAFMPNTVMDFTVGAESLLAYYFYGYIDEVAFFDYALNASQLASVYNGSTPAPTAMPTIVPTLGPTVAPTTTPSLTPTMMPTVAPTVMPTTTPTMIPTTMAPTLQPTIDPSAAPTLTPSRVPSVAPTLMPTLFPTQAPTSAPQNPWIEGTEVALRVENTANASAAGAIWAAAGADGTLLASLRTREPAFASAVGEAKVLTVAPTLYPMGDAADGALTIAVVGIWESGFLVNTTAAFEGTGYYYYAAHESTNSYYNIARIKSEGVFFEASNGSTHQFEIEGLNCSTVYHLFVVGYAAPNGYSYSAAYATYLEVTTAPLPPSLTSIAFSSSGASVVAQFSTDTDLGVTVGLATGSFECKSLFNFTGTAESCAWQSESKVIITLGSTSTLLPGDMLAILPARLKAACSSDYSEAVCAYQSYAAAQITAVSYPEDPVVPFVVSWYGAHISKCANATIDVSGSLNSGGREFHTFWHMSNTSSAYSDVLAEWISRNNQTTLTIPNYFLAPGSTYNLTVMLRNFLGGNTTEEISFYVSEMAIPSLILSGPRSIYVYDELEVLANAAVSICDNNTDDEQTLSYTWKVVGKSGLASVSANPRLFKLQPYSFESDKTYVVQATVIDSLGLHNTAIFTVTVQEGGLNAVILGGDRIIGTNAALLLDGRQSSDLDHPTGNTSGAAFHWRTAGGMSFDLANFSSNGRAMATFASSDLSSGSYLFTLQLEESERVSNNASVAVEIVDEALPESKITYVSAGKVNADSKLVIPSTITGLASARRRRRLQGTVVSASWSLEDDSYPVFNSAASIGSAALTEVALEFDGEAETLFYLVVAAGELIGGSTYSFRLEAGYAGSPTTSKAALTVEVNAPPSSGVVDASPSTGVVLQDTFDLKAHDWADDPDDFPLFYRFFYSAGGDAGGDACGEGAPSLLQAKSSDNAAAGVYLPLGNASVGADVLDRHGAAGRACAAPSPSVAALPTSVTTNGTALEALVRSAAAAALARQDPVAALNLAGIGAAAYGAGGGPGAGGFQRRLLGVLVNATTLLDASVDSVSRLADSLFGVVALSTSFLSSRTPALVLNLTDTVLSWGAELGALQDLAASDLTNVLGATLINVEPGNGNAVKLSRLVNGLTEVLAADLVEGETATELVSQQNILSIKVVKLSAADLAIQTITPATLSSKLNVTVTSQIVLNASAALTVMLSEFSSDLHTPAQTTNGSSAQLSDMLRLGVSGAANALSSFKVTIRFRSPASFNPAEIESGVLKCVTGMETVSYSCNGRIHSYNCNNQVGIFNFTCTSATVTPSCDIHNGTGWSSNMCEVLNYTTGAVTCLCSSERLVTSSTAPRRRLTVCDAHNNCEDAEAFEADLVANTQAIGSEIAGNFALTDNVLTEFSLVQQNYIVFVTMGSIMVGIPFLAFVAHFCDSQKGSEARCYRRRKAFKGDPKWRRKLQRLSILDDVGKLAAQVRHSASILRLFSKRNFVSDEDVDPAQEFFQKLQKKGWELLKDDILGGNEYLQLFQPADGYTRAVTVARVLVVLFTIMFWDCTICAVVFPPGYSDCYWIASEDECVNSDLICGWDPYSQGCAPYSLEDTPGTMLYVSALTLAITIPIMAFLEWFIVHTIEAEIPQPEEEGEETAVGEGDYLASDGWTLPTCPGEKSPAPRLGPEENKKKSKLAATLPPSHQPGLDGSLSLGLPAGGFAQEYQQNKEKDDNWVFPDSVGGSSHGLLSSRSSKNSSRAFMRPASRKELLDHRKPWLNRELVDNLVEERLAARTTSRTLMCIRWLGLGRLLRKVIRRDVVLTLNLQERIAQAHDYPEDQDALLFEAAWCDTMGDHMFALLHKYTVREDEDSGSGELICCLKPQLNRQAVFWRKVLGWVSLLIYCIVCGFYVCLFGVNYGEDYSVGWFKAFAVGFAEDMVLLSPMLAVSTFIAGRALARRPSLKALRSLANRPAHSHKSAVVLAAMRHPDLTVSKVLLDPFFEPPLSWQKRYNLQVDNNGTKYRRLRRRLWGISAVVAVAFLTLPPDIQGTLVQGSGVLALYYGASFCFANSSGGRKGSVYSIIILAAISVLFLWGYVLMPRERLSAFWNYMKTQLLPSFKKAQTQNRSPAIQNSIGKKDSSTAFSKQNQEQHQESPVSFSSSWSCEEGETSSTTKKLGGRLECSTL